MLEFIIKVPFYLHIQIISISCEYSTTNLVRPDLWDFHIEDRDGKNNTIKLKPGDMCVYDGCNYRTGENDMREICKCRFFFIM